MVEYVKANEDIKVVIAYRVDRITRNFRDAVMIDDLVKNYDKEIHFVDDRLVINRKSYGRDIQDWDLKVFLGKQLINRPKEDTKKSADHKFIKGEWPGQALYGYKNVTLENKRKWIKPDGIKAEIVKKAYEWYSTGTISMLGIRKRVQEEFGIKEP
ncbi:MAG: recombinase family protein [Candidatus Caenarcaniphilales bacterium]|nr:recombinase family protein [Candidatus Caenarcaniphilales bacterium]